MSYASPTRRQFLMLAASVAASTSLAGLGRAEAYAEDAIGVPGKWTGTISVDESAALHTVPDNFTGLSYESAQLANPEFFSSANRELIRLFRELSPRGVLRLGGGTSDYTTFSEQTPPGPPPFEIFGPDTSKTAKKGTITSARALRNLRGFLDVTGWTCLYGLNLAQGTKENAVAEAEAAHRILGPRLTALQIGNEPDTFGHFHSGGYSPQEYMREWTAFHDAIAARVPGVKFAGPDISNKLAYLTAFAAAAVHDPNVVLLTLHYYAMGPAGRPGMTLENLLSPNPRSTTMKWGKLPIVFDAMRSARLPCRISEMNSCWNGGEPDVSDVFGSALWCADTMLRFASLGFAGVNLHGGGDGVYSPIVGGPMKGLTRRPEYFGMLFAEHFAGATMVRAQIACDSDRVTAYAARAQRDGRRKNLAAVINKTGVPAELHLTGWEHEKLRWRGMLLSAPSVEARTGVEFKEVRVALPAVEVAAYSALLLEGDAGAGA